MGNWSISIEGIGCHHNDDAEDADRIARETVAKLKEVGHNISRATFTSGISEDLQPTEEKTDE